MLASSMNPAWSELAVTPSATDRVYPYHPGGNRMLKSIDPATGRELASFEEADEAAIEKAIAQAWEVRYGWRDAGIEHRARLLKDVAGVLRADKARYASTLTAEMGKPIVE